MTDEYLRIAMEISRSKTPNTPKMIKNFILAVNSLKSKIAEQDAEISAIKSDTTSKPKKSAAPKKTANVKAKKTTKK
jgi:hypothetical protein